MEKSINALVTKMAAHAGFDRALLEPARMRAIVARRMQSRALVRGEDYLALVESDAAELDALLNEVLVGETRFFRDAKVFANLGRWLAGRDRNAEVFRVLCAPCSTGEEVYSVAALLQSSGFTTATYEMVGLDLSEQALAAAQAGLYERYALRGVDAEHRGLVAAVEGDRWSVLDKLRDGVHFASANLALPGALARFGTFDLILCRNLLIYLSAESRGHLLVSLHDALRPEGRLVIGTADAISEIRNHFEPLRPASSFMLARRETLQMAEAAPAPMPHKSPAPASLPASPIRRTSPRRAAIAANVESLHLQAREFLAQAHLRSAERACRKALYLHPEHLPSLELLEKLWSAEPQSRRYRALTERLRRVQKAVSA